MPGYRLAKADKEALGIKYLCNSCTFLLKDAIQTKCGHFYCQSCLGNLCLNGTLNMTCVQDQVVLLPHEVFPDNFMRREVQALVVYCTFMEEGCKWKGEVRYLENHTVSCEFLKVPCVHPECGALVKKADLTEHLEKECKCRLETCGFCKKQIKLNTMKLHHEKECPAYPVKCEKCIKADITRAKDPFLGDCDGIQGPCPFSQIGCPETEVLTREQRKEHLEQMNTYHTTLILRHAVRFSRELEALLIRDPRIVSRDPHILPNYESAITDLVSQIQIQAGENRNLILKHQEHSERITALERKVASGNLSSAGSSVQIASGSGSDAQNPEITRRVTNVENRTADHEVLLVENNRTMEEVRRDMGNMKRQLDTTQESSRRHDRRIESIEHTLALRNVTLADLEEYVRQQEFSSYDGQLLWKISDYARKRNDAVTGQQVSFYSPCFYTSRYGYKMCARVYLNGDGMGRGTHISIFFVVMRGQYDALLRWPFRQKVTFMLLDQDNVEHVIDAFRPDPNSSSFQRPRRETNIASGCPMFCSLAELNNHAYVRDDAMFLKIIVDTSDL
ncbi:TNF receptor-associated factor 2-like isoform X2 [Stylophora pistillata]|uniref:TNF receptor-associated factor 2-like isoform X2 n=1 Tax=Stylophora pistillata TaxID=50429 RepID=UPI000C047A48|nr:TNF receptor-associated factor 2-like isoform X2 [Stylophora pistillata]